MRRVLIVLGIILFCTLVIYISFLGLKIIDGFQRLQKIEEKIKKIESEIKKIQQGRLEVWATAYTSSREECDNTPFITASGKKVFWGVIAADKKYQFGTNIYIPYFRKIFIVLDRGGKIKGNHIDIWMPDRDMALNFGRKKLIVYVVRGER
jgi:3D (Asp-Asp-Asp) domain-containing protein